MLLLTGGTAVAQAQQKVWKLNSLKSTGAHKPEVWGQPEVVKTKAGKAIKFDGQDDGLLLDTNPIAGADEFTIEVELKPYAAYPENVEQRFLHIQDPSNDKRRILIELRLDDKGQWYLDLFMRTEDASLTLIDSTKTHPVNEWATIRLTYKNGQLKGYVNGVEELSGEIVYLPISSTAKTSLGTRMDKRSWFNGEIRTVRFSHQVK
ncbi:LamG-like jellyroll fold domain-containing protein [Pontibacter korlensis]|nr:LamG-like jellyroll fold domain-containing protein [Pontibacter korlensis]